MVLAEWLMDKCNRDLTRKIATCYDYDWYSKTFLTEATKHRRNKESFDALPGKCWTDTWSDIFVIAQQVLNETSN